MKIMGEADGENESSGIRKAAKRLKRQRNRVDFQVSVLTAAAVIVSCSLIFFLNYSLSYKSMVADLKVRTLCIHEYLESRLDNDSFFKLLRREDERRGLYVISKEILERAKNATGVRYLYTAKMTDEGEFIYLVDGLADDSPDFRHVGDPIEEECIPDMLRALSGEMVLPERISRTSWGAVFISYFPMHEKDQVIGVVGIEFDAMEQYNYLRTMAIVTPAVIAIFCFLSAVVALHFFRRISNPSYTDIASMDFLTGLKNRNAFEIALNNLDRPAQRPGVSLVSIDLDNLKKVNDSFGHAAGDDYICLCCNVMKSCVGSEGILYRMGGDEFAVIFKDRTEEDLRRIMEKIHRGVMEQEAPEGYPMRISAGYAFFEPHMDNTLFDTWKRADAMMYECKNRQKCEKE